MHVEEIDATDATENDKPPPRDTHRVVHWRDPFDVTHSLWVSGGTLRYTRKDGVVVKVQASANEWQPSTLVLESRERRSEALECLALLLRVVIAQAERAGSQRAAVFTSTDPAAPEIVQIQNGSPAVDVAATLAKVLTGFDREMRLLGPVLTGVGYEVSKNATYATTVHLARVALQELHDSSPSWDAPAKPSRAISLRELGASLIGRAVRGLLGEHQATAAELTAEIKALRTRLDVFGAAREEHGNIHEGEAYRDAAQELGDLLARHGLA